MKKTIRISFVDFWSTFDYKVLNIYHILNNRYDLIVCENWQDSDYVFFSCFGNTHWEVDNEKIKIFFTAENIAPDFNVCDYAIGFETLCFDDRYLRQSNFYCAIYEKRFAEAIETGIYRDADLKRDFCSFVVSNGFADEYRIRLFNQLSTYKKVDSGGRYLNNIGGPIEDKLKFESTHKFSICCENSSHKGYTTEKLYQAFAAGCIPIYWGDPAVTKVFNSKAFVNAADYPTLDSLIERIKKIDCDNELYLNMLKEPIFMDQGESSYSNQQALLERFLANIFDQDITEAQRYSRHSTSISYLSRIKRLIVLSNMSCKQILIRKIKSKIFGT